MARAGCRTRRRPHGRHVTPAEAIEQRAAGTITTEQMLDTLLRWSYTFGRTTRVNDFPTDASIAGDWDEVERAFHRGQLTEDEFLRVADYALQQKSAGRGIDDPIALGQPEQIAGDRGIIAGELLHPQIAAAATAHTSRLTATGFTAEEVAIGLQISAREVDRMRLARELWTIPDGPAWRFPAAQFDTNPQTHRPIRQVPGLAHVLVALPADLHPLSINGFLHTTQPDLCNGREQTPLEWLRGGGHSDAAIRAAEITDWYCR